MEICHRYAYIKVEQTTNEYIGLLALAEKKMNAPIIVLTIHHRSDESFVSCLRGIFILEFNSDATELQNG